MLLPALVLLLLTLPVSLIAQGDDTNLEEVRNRLARSRDEAKRLASEESGILSSLMKLDENLTLTNRLLKGLESKRSRIEKELGELKGEEDKSSRELGRRRQLLKTRLRALYMFGGYHEFELLLGSTSVVDLVTRFDRIFRVARRDDELFHSVQEERVRLEEAREQLARRDVEFREVEQERTRERGSLLNRKSERKALLDDVRNKRESYEKLVAELEEASRELERIIATRSRKPGEEDFSGPSPFDGGGDRLPWPVQGRVIRSFGKIRHPEFGTVVANNGVDIEADYGTEIRAVAAGSVEYVSTLPGYGNCIILRHGGGYYTLYAHASEILVAQGARVSPGSVLAHVGDTGSLSGSSLHFEVRQGTKPLDPMRWLR